MSFYFFTFGSAMHLLGQKHFAPGRALFIEEQGISISGSVGATFRR
jgi:hypothetical protein